MIRVGMASRIAIARKGGRTYTQITCMQTGTQAQTHTHSNTITPSHAQTQLTHTHPPVEVPRVLWVPQL
jgi:hypothetical protein